MKKILFACLMLALTTGANAQQKTSNATSQDKTTSANAQKASNTVNKWEQPLKLTLDQKKKAKQIMLDKYDRHDKAVLEFKNDKNEASKKTKLDNIKLDTKTEMKALLDAEQFTKWEKLYNKKTENTK